MIRSFIAVGFVTVAVSLSTIAEAKVKKPVVCINFKEMSVQLAGDDKAAPVAMCLDGSKPVVLTTYTKITMLDEGGVKVPAIVGYR